MKNDAHITHGHWTPPGGGLPVGDDHDLALVHPAGRGRALAREGRGAGDRSLEISGAGQRLDVIDRIENDTARSAPRYAVGGDEEDPVIPTRAQLERSLVPSTESSTRLAERLGLTFVLRDLCRRRTPVHVTTDDGRLHGTLDRVARDHVDLALHEPGTPRRDRDVHGYRIVPLDRIVVVDFG